MGLKRRQFTKELKIQILREIAGGKSTAQVAREHQVHPNMIHTWRKQHEQYGDKAFQGNGNAYTDQARIAELERLAGQQALEIAFLKRVLQQLECRTHPTAGGSANK